MVEGYLLVSGNLKNTGFEGELILYDLKDKVLHGTGGTQGLFRFYGVGRFFKYTLQDTVSLYNFKYSEKCMHT